MTTPSTTPPTSAPTTEFRATRRTRNLMILLYTPIVLLALVMLALSTRLPPMLPLAVCLVLLGLVALGYAIAYGVRSRVVFGDGHYRQQFPLTTSTFAIDEVVKVVALDGLDYGAQSAAQLFVVGKVNPHLARLNDQTYERAQLEQLANELAGRGIPIDHVPGRLTLAQFDAIRPGLLFVWEAKRRRVVAITVVASVLVFGTIGVLSLMVAFSS